MSPHYSNAEPVVRPLVMVLAVIAWMGIYAILAWLTSSPGGRFRVAACGIAGFGFSLAIGWLIQILVFGPVGYAATERIAAEHFTLMAMMKVGAVVACFGLAFGIWVRVENRPLLVALVQPPGNVGGRALRPMSFLALYTLGWGVGALVCGLPAALGYV